jgi:hypothetical protein
MGPTSGGNEMLIRLQQKKENKNQQVKSSWRQIQRRSGNQYAQLGLLAQNATPTTSDATV